MAANPIDTLKDVFQFLGMDMLDLKGEKVKCSAPHVLQRDQRHLQFEGQGCVNIRSSKVLLANLSLGLFRTEMYGLVVSHGCVNFPQERDIHVSFQNILCKETAGISKTSKT